MTEELRLRSVGESGEAEPLESLHACSRSGQPVLAVAAAMLAVPGSSQVHPERSGPIS